MRCWKAMSESSAEPGAASSDAFETYLMSEPSARSASTWRGPPTPVQPGARAPASGSP